MSVGVSCPECGVFTSGVTDTRPVGEPIPATRRRRQCRHGHKFTTIEVLADTDFGALVDVSALSEAHRKAIRSLVRGLQP